MTGQPRGEHRHRHDEPPPQPRDDGVAAHHLPVRQDVRPSDVEGPVDVVRHGCRSDQVPQHVPYADRLSPGVNPTGSDHQRKSFGEIAQHFERRRAGADDDGRPQHGGGHRRVEEDASHLGPRAQVRGERPFGNVVRGQPAQVHDPPHPQGVRLLGEGAGRRAVGVLETTTGPERVHQVVRDVDAAHGGGYGTLVRDIALNRFDVRCPGVVAKLAGGAGQTPDSVAGPQQFRDQTPADVPGGPGDQAVQRLHGRLS